LRTIKSIMVTVNHPFEDCGCLKIYDGVKQVMPAIYLPPVEKPLKKNEKSGYSLRLDRMDIPHIIIEEKETWQLAEGGPRESVQVEIETEDN